MVNVYGVIAGAIGALMLAWSIREYLKGKLRIVPLLFWSLVWVGMISAGLTPRSYEAVTSFLGMSTPIHFVTSFSIVALLAITYQLHRRIGDLDSKMTKIVQEMALLQMPQGSPNKNPVKKD